MEHLEKLLHIVDSEIGSVAQNGKFRTRDEIDAVYKLIDIAKDVYCIWEYEEDEDEDKEEYSRMAPYSYARGRRGNVKRDSMGRYSRNYPMRYSRADGKEEYVEHLREMAEDAPDEKTRQEIHRMIRTMEQSM